MRRYGAWLLLVSCVAAALVLRRFVFVAWYPVVMSLAVAVGFGASLVRGEPLCLQVARRMPPHILPPGAETYCRRLTWLWTVWLLVNAGLAAITVMLPGAVWRVPGTGLELPVVWVLWNGALSYLVMAGILAGESCYRRRRFAAVFHTSGSTAKPKRIVKPFATLAREVTYHHRHLPMLQGARKPVFLATIEPEHMYGQLWRVLLPQVAGCDVDPEIIREPEVLFAKMRAAETVFLVTTPSFLVRFCAYAAQYEVPRNTAEIVTSGALLTESVSRATKAVFGRAPLEIFGSTETGGVASRRQGEDNGIYDWTVFDPVRVAVNAEGRLVVRSPFSFCRRYVMGDGVEMAPDGRHFKLLGRRDRLVKINEQRVSLPEMEARMATLPDVREVALVVLPGTRGDVLGAVCAVAAGTWQETAAEEKPSLRMRRLLLPIFPTGTVPRRYRFVAELPRNAQGKVQTARLREMFDGHA